MILALKVPACCLQNICGDVAHTAWSYTASKKRASDYQKYKLNDWYLQVYIIFDKLHAVKCSGLAEFDLPIRW